MTCICGKSKEVTNLDEKTEPKVCEGCKNDGDIKDVVFKHGKWIAMPCDFLSTRDPARFSYCLSHNTLPLGKKFKLLNARSRPDPTSKTKD
jgi:hypothetical protein